MMYLTERHIIKNSKELDEICFKSKNLYNKALYLVRQHYFETKKYLGYYDISKIMIDSRMLIIIHYLVKFLMKF